MSADQVTPPLDSGGPAEAVSETSREPSSVRLPPAIHVRAGPLCRWRREFRAGSGDRI